MENYKILKEDSEDGTIFHAVKSKNVHLLQEGYDIIEISSFSDESRDNLMKKIAKLNAVPLSVLEKIDEYNEHPRNQNEHPKADLYLDFNRVLIYSSWYDTHPSKSLSFDEFLAL